MAEKVGEVYIEASIDTTGVIEAGKAIAKTSDAISGSLNDAGKSVSRFGISLSDADKALGRFLDANNRVREANGRFASGMLESGQSVAEFNAAISKAEAGAGSLPSKLTKTAEAVDQANNSMKGFRGIASNVGFQLQDIAVQAQMGTNALVILGQQGSQFLGAFGAWGAIAGAVLAVASAMAYALLPAFMDSTTAAERLDKALETLGQTAEITDDGIAVLKKEIIELAKVSEVAVKARLSAALLEAKAAAQEAANGIANAFDSDLGVGAWSMDAADAIKFLENANFSLASSFPALDKTARQTGEAFGASGDKAKELGFEILRLAADASKLKTPESFSALENRIAELALSAEGGSEKVRKFVGNIGDLFDKSRRAAEITELLKAAMEDLPKVISETSEEERKRITTLEGLISAVEKQAAVVGMTERGIALYVAAQAGADQADLARINRSYDLIEAEEQKAQALKDSAQAIRDEAAEELKSIEAARKTEADQKRKVTTEFESVQTGVRNDLETPAQAAQRELGERLLVIQAYGEQEKMTQDEIDAYKIQAAAATEKKITDIKKQEEDARRAVMQTALGSIGDLFGNLADIAKEGGEKSFKTWKMMASAQAAINAALAITNVLATVPAPFNIPLAASVGALAAVNIAKINSQQYQGSGRLYGGPVQAGGMYPVNEDGRPEILQQGNRQYLLPNARGEVISNKDAQPASGGGGITINYNPTIYAQQTDFEEIMAGQPEAVLNAVRAGLASEGRTL